MDGDLQWPHQSSNKICHLKNRHVSNQDLDGLIDAFLSSRVDYNNSLFAGLPNNIIRCLWIQSAQTGFTGFKQMLKTVLFSPAFI